MPTTTVEQLEAQLESVRNAIAEIESGGQSVIVNGRRIDGADVRELYKRERYLERRISRARGGGGIRSHQVIPRDG